MAIQPLSSLTTSTRRMTGEVPPVLVGASTTVVGNRVYLFGGRLGATRRLTSDLYVLDLRTSEWKNITPSESGSAPHAPAPRYFHSADSWNGFLVVFGGVGYGSNNNSPGVLNDVRFFSLVQHRWIPAAETNPLPPNVPPHSSCIPTHDPLIPRPRYAHISSVTDSRLFVIGGQDMPSQDWLDDIHVFDLFQKRWIERREYPRHCGMYRSLATAPQTVIRDPVREGVPTKTDELAFFPVGKATSPSYSVLPPHPPQGISDRLVFCPYSDVPSLEHPAEIHLYSNYNFSDVKRELEVFTPTENSFYTTDRSDMMNGSSFPPGLRFPTGAILGNHLIIAGTYLSQSYQCYSIWALDLNEMTWSRIDTGAVLATGSWTRGILWGDANTYVIFGNPSGNMVEDYNHRILNWSHAVHVELETFGIYTFPTLQTPVKGQVLGLDALEAELFADFEILCEDGRKIKCSRKLVEERWPWFKRQRINYVEAAKKVVSTHILTDIEDVPLPDSLPNELFANPEDRPDPRLTPRMLRLSEPYPITKALLQYFYSGSLITPLQHAPLVLSALLLLSNIYELAHLAKLVKHAMHQTLSPATSVDVYEVATLCDSQNLQIRALRMVLGSNRNVTQQSGQDYLRSYAARLKFTSQDNIQTIFYGTRTNGRCTSAQLNQDREKETPMQSSNANITCPDVIHVGTKDPMQRWNDSDTRGLPPTDAKLPPASRPDFQLKREGSLIPTRVSSLSLAEPVVPNPMHKRASMNPANPGSLKQRPNKIASGQLTDQTKMINSCAQIRQDVSLPPFPPLDRTDPHTSPLESHASTEEPPRFLLMSPTEFPHNVSSFVQPSREVSRQQSADTLGLRHSAKSSRPRSLSDAGPSRPYADDSVQSISSLATSIERTRDVVFIETDDADPPRAGKVSLPPKALKILGNDDILPTPDSFLSDTHPDQHYAAEVQSISGTSGSGRSTTTQKSGKWSRLLSRSTDWSTPAKKKKPKQSLFKGSYLATEGHYQFM
ncbi:uncharacterized protein EI90DRAFT_3117737 [Cantharellus anzutake]|uniref:uncharacterized protein n=1 Tax=Cantharellus anzutake TaxID=1750568 RepID=UPI00190584A1|nr:uncharacterized protein EI90DRAFT_3117737 [Cantharellus anzutake]KAF8339964.1 hypothetical protein EI90DRAFT_3117737 [Cantharellus anzutake]